MVVCIPEKRSRKPFGYSSANLLSSGSSRDIYALSGNSDLKKVVFPDCRGPVTSLQGIVPKLLMPYWIAFS